MWSSVSCVLKYLASGRSRISTSRSSHLGSHPIVTPQHSPAALCQAFDHTRSPFLFEVAIGCMPLLAPLHRRGRRPARRGLLRRLLQRRPADHLARHPRGRPGTRKLAQRFGCESIFEPQSWPGVWASPVGFSCTLQSTRSRKRWSAAASPMPPLTSSSPSGSPAPGGSDTRGSLWHARRHACHASRVRHRRDASPHASRLLTPAMARSQGAPARYGAPASPAASRPSSAQSLYRASSSRSGECRPAASAARST